MATEKQNDMIAAHVRRLFEKPEQFRYPEKKFAHLKHLETENFTLPKGPGDKVYGEGLHLTARRITGADQGFPFSYSSKDSNEYRQTRPIDVPQDIIKAYRTSFQDGLELYLPDNVLNQYLKIALTAPAFSNNRNNTADFATEGIKMRMPRLTTIPHKSTRSEGSTRSSLEHELRNSFNPAVHDTSTTLQRRHDRKHLDQMALYNTYKFYKQNPELWAAMVMIQDAIQSFASDIQTEIAQQKIQHASTDNAIDLILNGPCTFALDFTYLSIGLESLPLFFGAAALTYAEQQNKASNGVIAPGHIINGIIEAQKAGIFRIKYDTPFGERATICPFGSTGVRWFTMDTAGQGDPKDALIVKALAKIYEERGSNMILDKFCERISNTFESILRESDHCIIQKLESAYSGAPTIGCPFHNDRD